MNKIDAETKIIKIENEDEKKVARFLLNLELEFIDCNLQIGELKHNLLGEIDLLYKFQDYLFLIEVSKKTNANEKRFGFFTKWTDEDILKWITEQYKLQPKKIFRIYFEMNAQKPQSFPSPLLEKMTKKGKRNLVIYSNQFENLEKINSNDARNEFLNSLKSVESDSLMTTLKRYFRKN